MRPWNIKDVRKTLQDNGCVLVRPGEHEIWMNPNQSVAQYRKVAVPAGHRVISPGVLRQLNKMLGKKIFESLNLREHDLEIQRHVDSLVKKENFVEIVKKMTPLDIAEELVQKFELCPHDAASITLDIVRKVREGLASGPNIETNKDFPVPSSIRGDNDSSRGEEEDELSKAAHGIEEDYIGNLGGLTPTFSQDQFPPCRNSEDGFPYDGMTNAKLNSKFQGKRGLTSGYKRSYRFIFNEKTTPYVHLNKDPLKQDLRFQPVAGDSGRGFSITTMQGDGDEAGQGSSWSTRGRPGWSKETSDKVYDMPDATNDNPEYQKMSEETVEDDFPQLSILKQPPVGTPIPTLRFSGRVDGGVAGGRKGFRKR